MLEQPLNLYWKTVVDTIQEGVMVVDQEGAIVSVNRALEGITGYKRDELVGESCATLNCSTCEQVRHRRGEKWCHLFASGSVSSQQCDIVTKSGNRIRVLKNASVLYDGEGRVLGAVETLTDLTEIIEKDTQIEAFRRELRAKDGFHGMVGVSAAMKQVFDLISNAAPSDAPVIIHGESGTGKELVASALHGLGPRREKPFVKVNCAALTESLLESELFGHVKGAYTGAYRDRKGRFEEANGGDIFLDEIGDLPFATQVKLLRVLEQKVIERVGDNRSIEVDVRIISATNKDLTSLVEKGTFRDDLFFRINVIPITLPPLRERPDDIALLAESFFRTNQLKSGKEIRGITNGAMALLTAYEWPGNVRELRSAFEYAFVTCQESLIQPHHFPPAIHQRKPGKNPGTKAPSNPKKDKKSDLIHALKQAGGNQSEAARILGVSRVTVWNRIRQFGIDLKHRVEI
jgi:two-component system, NtrC family, response regulator HydG